jgi:hypothetical protein
MIDHLGPRKAVFIGSGFIWFGLFLIWLSVEKKIASSVSSLCIYIYIAQLGSATMSQGSSSTAMLIMPSAVHGEVASIAKAYYGIAEGVLSSIAGTLRKRIHIVRIVLHASGNLLWRFVFRIIAQ